MRVLGMSLFIAAMASVPARAAGLLPIAVGEYYSSSRADCGGPAALGWNGKGFTADYVYVDNIVKVEKTGPAAFVVTSRTKIKDDNTDKSGMVWRADIHVLSAKSFTFLQYALTESSHEAPQTYRLCGKS